MAMKNVPIGSHVVNKGKTLKYNSVPTRFSSLHGFMGGAELNSSEAGMIKLPIDKTEDLIKKHRSGVNRVDLPSCYGPARMNQSILNCQLSNLDAVAGWIRVKGEPR